jgi:NADPH:quinone reductase-like Zn-dependent oxidoreductase
MRAAVLHAPGGPDAFAIEDVPMPVCEPDDVLVRVRACGVSFRDVVERNGTYRRDVSYPLIIGLEISGEVVAMGDLVEDLAIGDHVCTKAFSSCGRCRLCRSGRETTCAKRRPVRGGYAEYVALPQDAFVRAPRDMPFEVSCGLGPGAGVALNAVRDTAKVTIGETLLVTGATGGVGVPSVQIARASGARVIAVTRSVDKAAMLEEIGVHDVIVADAGENFAKQVRALTGGQGVDVVIDTVGSRVFDAAYDSLAVHGRYTMVGQLFGEDIAINPARIFFKRAQILGVGSVSRAQLEDAIGLAAAGVVKPQIAQILPLEAVARAHELVEGGAVAGRVVLTP